MVLPGWLPTLALTLPSFPIVTSAPGGTVMGAPPLESTGRPLPVTKLPSVDTSKWPLRV